MWARFDPLISCDGRGDDPCGHSCPCTSEVMEAA